MRSASNTITDRTPDMGGNPADTSAQSRVASAVNTRPRP